jgi:putative transposase
MTQVFFNARELAEIAVKCAIDGFPQSERGVQVYAARKGWNNLPSNLCRKRKGRGSGGGREYHISILLHLNRKKIKEMQRQEQLLTALLRLGS